MNRFPCLSIIIALAWTGGAAAAEEAALPELPAMTRDTPTIETGDRAALPNPMPSNSLPASRQMPSAEQLEQLKKDKNWLVEGMKDRQATEAQDSRPAEDMSQSIIDMVLKKQQPGAPPSPRSTEVRQPEAARTPTAPAGSVGIFRPSISTSAFDPLPGSQESQTGTGGMDSILARERALAGQSNFSTPASAAPPRDPLANPFGNLPIPEGALPASPRSRGTYSVNDPMLQSPWSNPGPSAPQLNANPALPAPGAGLAANESGAPAPIRSAVEQPYDYLRTQEKQRLQEQRNNNRPTARQLRSPVPDPTEARLF